jgi:uncharacterized protein (DUF983 family)
MSAFNTLHASVVCPACGHTGVFDVQFKFGDTWQYTYKLGDPVRWGGNDYGSRTEGEKVVEGIGGPCPVCAAENLPFAITVRSNQIETIAAR